MGCEDAQGYLFARPMAAKDATELLSPETPSPAVEVLATTAA
jgi:EAL domain-containing protein (putative c-di-GMP-specific phosphodiesterase class I)